MSEPELSLWFPEMSHQIISINKISELASVQHLQTLTDWCSKPTGVSNPKATIERQGTGSFPCHSRCSTRLATSNIPRRKVFRTPRWRKGLQRRCWCLGCKAEGPPFEVQEIPKNKKKLPNWRERKELRSRCLAFIFLNRSEDDQKSRGTREGPRWANTRPYECQQVKPSNLDFGELCIAFPKKTIWE